MMRSIFVPIFLAVVVLQGHLTAQINNYYNAPSRYALPGTPALPGNTPVTQTTTTTTVPATTVYGTVPATTYATNPPTAVYGTVPTTTYTTPTTATTTYATSPTAGSTLYGTNIYSTSTPQQYGTSTYYGTPTYATPTYGSTLGTPSYGTGFVFPQHTAGFPTTGVVPGTTNVSTAFTTPIRTTSGVLYPPSQPIQQQTATVPFNPITVPVPAHSFVEPPETWAPGLMTIKDGRWIPTDFLYNLPFNIGVKVVIVKPQDRYMPLSEALLEKRISEVFADASLVPNALTIACEPPLPLFLVTVMAYPCEKRCVGVVTAQLYEVVQPQRIDRDLSGVWQAITWERQELVASPCDGFFQEVESTITTMAQTFTWQYNHFNPLPARECFPTGR